MKHTRTKVLRYFILVVILGLQSQMALGQSHQWKKWIDQPPVPNGNIASMCRDSAGGIFVCAQFIPYGVYYSSDQGVTWVDRSRTVFGLPKVDSARETFADIVTAPDGKVYGSSFGGVCRFEAASQIWRFVPNSGDTAQVNELIPSPSGSLFVVTQDGAVDELLPDGATWVNHNGFTPRRITALTVTDQGTLIAMRGPSLARSTDRGASWQDVAECTGAYSGSRGLRSKGALTMAVWNSQCLTSLDDGLSWKASQIVAGYPSTAGDLIFSPAAGKVYAFGRSDLIESLDSGATWNVVSTPFHQFTSAVLWDSHNRLLTGTLQGGVYVREDETHWNPIHFTSISGDVSAYSSRFPGRILAASSTAGLLRSNDTGRTWESIDPGVNTHGLSSILEVSRDTLIGTDALNNLVRSSDGGTTWLYMRSLSSPSFPPVATPTQAGYFVSHNGDLYQSSSPSSRILKVGFPTPNLPIYGIRSFENGDLFLESKSAAYVSHDLGKTLIASNLASNQLQGLLSTGSDSNLYQLTSSELFRSTDHGITFETVTANMIPSARTLFVTHAQTLLEGDTYDLLKVSTDNGKHWATDSLGLNGAIVSAISESANGIITLYTTNGGVFVSDHVSAVASKTHVSSFGILSTYPNPASGSIRVELSSEGNAHSRLTLVNELGTELRVIKEATVSRGETSLEVDLAGLPAGAYFLRFEDVGHIYTKAIVKY